MKFVNGLINDFESKERDPMIPNYSFNDLNQNLLV